MWTYTPENPRKTLATIIERVHQLLLEDEDPEPVMRELENRLADAGVVPTLRTESVLAFIVDLEAVLSELDPMAICWPTSPLESYETAAELVLDLIP